MLHLIKYSFKKTIRNKDLVFWPLVFPLILCTLFYFAFGTTIDDTSDININAAVVYEDGAAENQDFEMFLQEIDENIHTEFMTETEAIKALKDEEVSGIYFIEKAQSGSDFVGSKIKLQILGSGYYETVLKGYLDGYKNYEGIVMQISEKDPSKLQALFAGMKGELNPINSVSLGGKAIDSTVQYFYALIAYACLAGSYLGASIIYGIQANVSDIAKRNSVTPINKMKFLISSLITSVAIHFVNMLILLTYITYVLRIYLWDNIGYTFLFALLGSFIGISFGMVVASFGKGNENIKSAILTVGSLFMAFLAGMMYDEMKLVIESTVPIVNRINPAAVITDAFYSIATYGEFSRLKVYLLTLIAEVIICLIISFFNIRRKTYDSI